jgi:hypothetical protein
VRKPLAPSRADACNPLLQAHPTWARDKHEGRGFPLLRLSPSSFSPLRALSRADPSGLGHATTIYSSVQGPPGVKTPTNRFIVADNSTISGKCNNIYIHTWAFWRSLVVDQVFSQQVVLFH